MDEEEVSMNSCWALFGSFKTLSTAGQMDWISSRATSYCRFCAEAVYCIHSVTIFNRPGVAGAVLQTPSSFIN